MNRAIHLGGAFLAAGSMLAATGCSDEPELEPFESCDALEEYIEKLAYEEYTWDGSEDDRGTWGGQGGMGAPEADMAAPMGDDDDAGSSNSHSTTNTQESGVDESDFVKNDGEFIYVLNGEDLAIIDAWPAEEMAEVARLTLEGYPEELYLDGDTIAVLTHLSNDVSPMGGRNMEVRDQVTKITIIDVADRTDPQITREVYVEGSLYDSRRVDERLYLITSRDLADTPLQQDLWGRDLDDDDVRQEVEAQALEDWMPRRGVNTRNGQEWTLAQDSVCGCTDIYRPSRDGGLNMMSVLALDFSVADSEITGTSVLAGNAEVYATPDSLYLAVYEPDSGPFGTSLDDYGTRIHKFDLEGGPAHPVYEASGRVDGWTHNSFAMDDAEGTFRIVTTSYNHGGLRGTPGNSTGLYMLEQDGNRLDVIGQTEGIAPDEDVYAVRFTDDIAYVVTFMQIDPLFTIDLRDPTSPEVLGELEVTGYSTYMHPLDDGHLLAVGEAVDPAGVQISLFDVTDLSDPQLQDREIVETGWSGSEAIYDHHAFNYYEPMDLFAVPINSSYGWGDVEFAGLYVYDVTVADGIDYVGEIDASVFVEEEVDDYYAQYCAQVRRSIIIEDVIYAVAAGGIIAAQAEQPEESLATLAFPDNGNCDEPWSPWDDWEEDW